MISEGSELLLLVDSMKNMVGSVVLPVLGAVPDCAIVLFSGLGENAAEQVISKSHQSITYILTIP